MFTLSTAVSAGTPDDDYNLAVKLYKDSKWSTAEAAFKAYVKNHPTDERVTVGKLYLGITLAKQGKNKEAHSLFADYAARNPQGKFIADALYRAGRASYLQRNFSEAAGEYKSFLDRFPKHEYRKYALIDYADSLSKQEKYDVAITAYTTWLGEFSKDPLAGEAQVSLAQTYEQAEKFDDAVKLWTTVATDGTDAQKEEAAWSIAGIQFRQANYTEAAAGYSAFIQNYPASTKLPQAQLNVGFAQYQQKNYQEALALFETATKTESIAGQANYWKSLTLKALLRYDEAVPGFEALLKENSREDLTDSLLYHLADCHLRTGKLDAAQQGFLTVVEKYSTSPLADDSMLYAAEAALRANDLDKATTLVEQFSASFPRSPLFLYHALQEGRLRVKRGSDEDLKAALKIFQDVLAKTQIPRTRNEARFQIATVQQRLQQHSEALETIKPNLEALNEQGRLAIGAEAFALAASSHLALDNYTEARQLSSTYLEWRPDGLLADQALVTLAIAERELGNAEASEAARQQVLKTFPKSPLIPQATWTLAEAAYAANDWDASAMLFQWLVDQGKEGSYFASGLSGLAWTRFEQEQFEESAKLFARVVNEAPQSELMPEAAWKQGHALQEAKKLDDALSAYAATWQKLAPAEPAKAGAEDGDGDLPYAYRSGLQAARIASMLDKIDEAHKWYGQVVTAFPKVRNLDKLLDEWALLNYENDRFKEADVIFRRIVTEVPDSDLADDAKLSLAESELIANKLPEAEKLLLELVQSEKADTGVKELAQFHLTGIALEQQNWKKVQTRANAFLSAWPKSSYAPEIQYHAAEASLNLNDLEGADKLLTAVKSNAAGTPTAEAAWYDRVFVLLAEIAFRKKDYSQVETLVKEVRTSDEASPWLYQLDEIQGRALKNQAKFDESREAFGRVLVSETGRGTSTAAKAQFLIGETWLTQKKYEEALLAFLKVNELYNFAEWQAPALFQAARCHEALSQWAQAVASYDELMKTHPESPFALQSKPLREAAASKVKE